MWCNCRSLGRVATTASVTSVTFTVHRPRALDQNFDVYRTLGLLPKSTRIIVVVAGPRLRHVSTPHRLIQHECHKYGRSALQGIHTSLHQISFVPFRFVIITITHQNGTHTKCWCWLTTLHFHVEFEGYQIGDHTITSFCLYFMSLGGLIMDRVNKIAPQIDKRID